MEHHMGTGIIVCGLNGSGKSTLGKALAEKLDFHFIDNENLYFPKTNPNYVYSSPRTREEVEKLLFSEIKAHENFVFASVKGDYGEHIYPFFRYAVLIDVSRIFGYNELEIVLFKNSVIECQWAAIYMSRKKSSLNLLNLVQKTLLKNGYNL